MFPHTHEQWRIWSHRLALSPHPESICDAAAQRAAAVLIPVILRHPEPTVLLTRRSDHLSTHAGQISFPGGASEPGDVDAVATALRESREEIGLLPSAVEILACLRQYPTVSGFCVTPVLGVIQSPLQLRADPQEVAEIFELPLRVVLDPARYEKRWVERRGVRGVAYFLECDNRVVWGITAGILLELARCFSIDGAPKDLTRDSRSQSIVR